jgi:hypothetical protein
MEFPLFNGEIATSPGSVLVNEDDLRKAIRNDVVRRGVSVLISKDASID